MRLAALVAALAVGLASRPVQATTGTCDAACQTRERTALLTFYNGLHDSPWYNSSGWATPNTTTHCTWKGVGCCSARGVAVIPFPNSSKPYIFECDTAGACSLTQSRQIASEAG